MNINSLYSIVKISQHNDSNQLCRKSYMTCIISRQMFTCYKHTKAEQIIKLGV